MMKKEEEENNNFLTLTIQQETTYSDLYKEISQVLLKGRNILIQVIHPLHCNLDLILCEVRERRLQEVGYKALHVCYIVGAGGCGVCLVQTYRDAILFNQGEHVG